MQVTHDTLAAYCQHPNVGAVLVVALGCEQVVAQTLAESARGAGKPSAIVSIQGEGGTPRAIAKGTIVAAGLADDLSRVVREWCDIESLILSLKCGGSDYTSGLGGEPRAGPRRRSAAHARRLDRARRDRRDHGRRAAAGGARHAT